MGLRGRQSRLGHTNPVSIFVPPSVRRFEPKRIAFSTWVDHIAFAYDVVAEVQPSLLVELGTQGGTSYFAFCQSVKENDLDTVCFAVDTWEGEKHTGAYDEEVFDSVNFYNRQHYPGFSYLMRMLFSEAAGHFGDESIDLLHIDGLHTYDAVSEDFRTWFPKVRPGGIVLFHDVQARMMDFGVWRFWGELQREYETFTFNQGFGLGVLRKPGGAEPETPLLRALFRSDEAEQSDLRAFYAMAARYLLLDRRSKAEDKRPRLPADPARQAEPLPTVAATPSA